MLRYKLLALYAALIVNILIISMFQRLIPTGNTRVFAVMALWGWASAVAGISFLWNEAPRSKLRGILQSNINSSAASREYLTTGSGKGKSIQVCQFQIKQIAPTTSAEMIGA